MGFPCSLILQINFFSNHFCGLFLLHSLQGKEENSDATTERTVTVTQELSEKEATLQVDKNSEVFYGLYIEQSTSLLVREVWVSIPGKIKSDTVSPQARYRCNVSSNLCSPGAKSRRLASPLVTRFGAIRLV